MPGRKMREWKAQVHQVDTYDRSTTLLFQYYVPNFCPARLPVRALDVERDDIAACFLVGVERMLLGGGRAIAEFPLPGGHLAIGLVLEGYQSPAHVEDVER